ncbi:MAG: nitroreductase family deazaflavin-dependent oxidoreductase [Actinomycetota bacterium]
MPSFMRHINKYTFNRRELARGDRPVLTHVGRLSGAVYRTPVEAIPVDGGYAIVLVYGADATDWVKNACAAGRATLTVDGVDRELTNPRVLVGDEAWDELPPGTDRPPALLRVDEVLRLDAVSG